MIDPEYAESPEGFREHIAELQAELATARAELQRGQGWVPNVCGLLPCPCCGSEPVVETGRGGGKYIECTEPRCRLSTPIIFPCGDDVRALLVEIWNKRASRLPSIKEGEVVPMEELATLREIVRLLDEARQRYARVPRAGAATSMGDEIDELLCRLYEMGAHPADMRPKPPTPDVVPVPMEELAVLRDGFGLLRTAWNLSLCGERIGAQAGALIERYDALRAGEAGKGGAT